MNNFSVYIKENGTYEKINGVAVFPFNFGQLLDEQLDEAHLVIKMSPKEHYEPLTEMKIEVFENSKVIKEYYFVVAQDNAYEFPVKK